MLRETKLCCSRLVNQRSYSVIKCVDTTYEHAADPQHTKFVLQPIDDSPNKFYIEMPFGETRPKLISYNKSINIASNIISSAKESIAEE